MLFIYFHLRQFLSVVMPPELVCESEGISKCRGDIFQNRTLEAHETSEIHFLNNPMSITGH
jgi:hypothetical protein